MPREKEGFRDNLVRIVEKFPDKEMLNIAEVSQFLGLERRAVRRHIKFNTMKMITLSDLARQISL